MMEGLLRDDEPSTGLYDTYKVVYGVAHTQLTVLAF